MAKNNKSFTRREFINRTAKGAVGLAGYSLLNNTLLNANDFTNNRSTVVVVKHDNASKIEYQGNKKLYNVDQSVAQVMMDEGIRQLTGINDIGEAWKSFFPGPVWVAMWSIPSWDGTMRLFRDVSSSLRSSWP